MRSACFVSAFVLGSCLLLATSDANAQGTPPPADGLAAPTTAQPGGPPPPPPRRGGGDEEEFNGGRFRVGFTINGGLGTQSVGNFSFSGPVIGGTVRLGYQITELIAVYGNISPFAWIATTSTTGPALPGLGAGSSTAAGIQTTPMIGITPVDLLEIGAGPSIDYVGAVNTTASGTVAFGLHGRVGLILGGRKDTGRRRGFTISGDVHPIFTSGAVTTFFTLGLGADWY